MKTLRPHSISLLAVVAALSTNPTLPAWEVPVQKGYYPSSPSRPGLRRTALGYLNRAGRNKYAVRPVAVAKPKKVAA